MLKLILADNQAIFRAGIAKVLAVEDEMRIVAQAQTAEQMFMALDKFRAAVLIIAGGFTPTSTLSSRLPTRTRRASSYSPTPARARSATWRRAPMASSIAT
jgi:DNA-binding NarL/FixJ family response regulator